MKVTEETNKNNSILHDLIQTKSYQGVYIIKEIATSEQWDYLKYIRKLSSNDDDTNESDLIYPFFLALANH